MKIAFVVSVDLDPVAIEREGKRAGFPTIQRATEAVLSDIENRLHDCLRYRDGVVRIGVELAAPEGVH